MVTATLTISSLLSSSSSFPRHAETPAVPRITRATPPKPQFPQSPKATPPKPRSDAPKAAQPPPKRKETRAFSRPRDLTRTPRGRWSFHGIFRPGFLLGESMTPIGGIRYIKILFFFRWSGQNPKTPSNVCSRFPCFRFILFHYIRTLSIPWISVLRYRSRD